MQSGPTKRGEHKGPRTDGVQILKEGHFLEKATWACFSFNREKKRDWGTKTLTVRGRPAHRGCLRFYYSQSKGTWGYFHKGPSLTVKNQQGGIMFKKKVTGRGRKGGPLREWPPKAGMNKLLADTLVIYQSLYRFSNSHERTGGGRIHLLDRHRKNVITKI